MERPSSPEPSKRWRPRRLRTIALIPTLITLGNGVCGVLAILQIGYGLALDKEAHFHRAAWFILGAMIFDALDGFVARMTKTASPFGAQLDSLCDLVTFGVAPAFLVFAVSREFIGPDSPWARPIQAVCVVYAMCALIRLARFTVETAPDEGSHREFAGLPSPAAAGVIASAVLPWRALRAWPEVTWLMDAIQGALPGLAFAVGVLMVSRVKYSHVVNRVLRGRRPFVTLVELTLLVALAWLVREVALFVAFFGYAVTGPALWVKKRLSRRAASGTGVLPSAPSGRDERLF